MSKNARYALVVLLLSSLSCKVGAPRAGAQTPPIPIAERNAAAQAAVALLQAGQLEEARAAAQQVLGSDAGNPRAHLVLALAEYRVAMQRLAEDIMAAVAGAAVGSRLFNQGQVNMRYWRFALDEADKALGSVDAHLETAARVPDASLEFCLACWPGDWNSDGKIDERDTLLLQIELDENGNALPEGDPRRKPTYRFDLGDFHWATAMVAFQRAALAILVAYDISDIPRVFRGGSKSTVLRIPLTDAESVRRAKRLILAALDASDRSRLAILAETDDDREWLPNPRQKNHPMPLPVDDKLFETWEGVIADLRSLMRGETGIDVAALMRLPNSRRQNAPGGFINVSKLFDAPGDIVLEEKQLKRIFDPESRADAEAALRELFGAKYVAQMPAGPIFDRLRRMADEVARGMEPVGHKLRYLFWIN